MPGGGGDGGAGRGAGADGTARTGERSQYLFNAGQPARMQHFQERQLEMKALLLAMAEVAGGA